MKISTQLSVSSVILAAVLTAGCSQQQVYGGSQLSGSQQVSGGSQVSGSGQMSSQSQIEGSAQVGSQQQVENVPVVAAPVYRHQPVYVPKPKPKTTVKRTVRRSGIGLPPAKPGQCFAKVKTPEKYVTKSRKVLVRKATSKRVLVRGPQYGWSTKRVLVRKASYKTRTIPAQYKTVSHRVMVKPATYKWSRKAQGNVVRIDNMTGEILCRVKVPAVYKTVSKRVLVRPARTIRSLVPATYKTVKVKKLIAPAKYKVVSSPAQYKTQNYRVKVGSSRIVWRQVMCKTHHSYKKHYAKPAYRKPVKQYHKPAYHKPVKHYRKASYRKPVKQYRKMAPHRVMHKTATKYRKPLISQREYYSVMNAGKKVTQKTAPRSSRNAGISPQEYYSVMNAGKKVSKKSVAKKAASKKKAVKLKKVKHTSPKKMMKSAKPKEKTVSNKAAEKSATTDAKKQMSKQNIIRSIQKALKAKGFDPGAIDGKMGAGTAAALKAFQSSHGLPVGRLTKDTFRALGLIR